MAIREHTLFTITSITIKPKIRLRQNNTDSHPWATQVMWLVVVETKLIESFTSLQQLLTLPHKPYTNIQKNLSRDSIAGTSNITMINNVFFLFLFSSSLALQKECYHLHINTLSWPAAVYDKMIGTQISGNKDVQEHSHIILQQWKEEKDRADRFAHQFEVRVVRSLLVPVIGATQMCE